MRRKLKTITNNENDSMPNLETRLNESPQRFNMERKAQQNLEQISSQQQLISRTIDVYDGWNQVEELLLLQKQQPQRQLQSLKGSLDTSFKVKRNIKTAQTSVSRTKRAQSFKEVLNEAKIYLNILPLELQRFPNRRKKQFQQKEQIKYFQGFRDRDERKPLQSGINTIIQVKGYKK